MIIASVALFFYCLQYYPLWSALVLLGLITIGQVVSLVHMLDRTNDELISFLNAIRYDDFSINYSTRSKNSSFDRLHLEFNKVMQKFQQLRAEKEAHYHYFRTIVQHVGIGIITSRKNGNVEILNTAAKRLLGIARLQNINDLEELSPDLVRALSSLQQGDRALVKIKRENDTVQIAISAIELVLQGEVYRLVSLQNIQSELEEKEMEAWQNLIRVLTHEIMNSVTPISSIAATAGNEILESLNGEDEDDEYCTIRKEDLEDIHLGIDTIRKRSIGLIHFVSDFRNLARVPTPKLSTFTVKELFDQICLIMKPELKEGSVQLHTSIEPSNLQLTADNDQIEQVLINLVKNAIQAFDCHEDRRIWMSAYVTMTGRTLVEVRDNGPGIEKDAVDKIFIPFFTTKKTGSGIGLSLSKQIMRYHKGSIQVKSVEGEGTTFTLIF
jgi:two-component system, NtrC family, nitrogen regulation sensor histidine kinase NtrY